MRRLLLFLLISLPVSGALWLSQVSRLRDVYRTICDLTEDHFYKSDARLEKWIGDCRLRAKHVRWNVNEASLLLDIQDLMNGLQVSHFQVYDPSEDRKLWKGESIDTGIRARFIEDLLVVYRVENKSAAQGAGVRVGDEIVSIQGIEQVTPWGAIRRTGRFVLKRRAVEIPVNIRARTLTVDSSPRLVSLSNTVGLLTLGSFRSEYFRSAAWRRLITEFPRYPHLIVDVRENAGGSFVAMLRALSTLQCADHVVGKVLQPRKALPPKPAFDDDDSDAHQIAELEKYSSIGLRTFAGYGCYTGRVTVLISSDTSSVAEIFAQSFLHHPRARVWGQPSAGDVVLAVWYDLPSLGVDYSVSIPEAIYLTTEGSELEGQGVTPQRELHYDLERALVGKDNWLEEAMR